MNELKLFTFKDEELRTVKRNNDVWFLGNDVAKILQYSNYRATLNRRVDSDDKLRIPIVYAGQQRKVTFINEPGIYSLVFGSKVPEAKTFKKWITHKVLPSIRKTGSYSTESSKVNNLINAPKSKLFKLAYESQLAKEKSEKQLKVAQPKANYFDTQMKNPGLMTVSVIANKYGISAKELNQKLHAYRVIYKVGKTWHLYQNYKGYGYASYDKYAYNRNKRVSPNLKWTQKGEKMIYNLFKSKNILPESEKPKLDILI